MLTTITFRTTITGASLIAIVTFVTIVINGYAKTTDVFHRAHTSYPVIPYCTVFAA